MNKTELTKLNVGYNLDLLMNLDPRGYGVCRILYDGASKYTGKPLSLNGAEGLVKNIKKGEKVFILTGFILLPWNEAETDGIISSTVFARFVIRAFGAKPVMIVPEQCEKAIKAMSEVLGVNITYDIDNIPDNTICIISFTKDKNKENEETAELLSHGLPCAVISNEAPGRNKNAYYHNAVGRGVYNLSIGDLGNELGMGTIEEHIRKYIPYAEKGGCKAGTGFGILADTAADNIITATVSDWGMNALMACTAFLLDDVDLFHTEKEESAVMDAAAKAGMLDMYGEARPYIDGIGKNIVLPIISLMRGLIEYPHTVEDKTDKWFETTIKKGYFK